MISNNSSLGNQILSERNRFAMMFPSQNGQTQCVEIADDAFLQGIARPAGDDGFSLSLSQPRSEDGPVQVFYERKEVDRQHSEEATVTRVILCQRFADAGRRLETWHRDTEVSVQDGAVISDHIGHATAIYPEGGGYGQLVADDPLPQLPLSASQELELTRWNVTH